MHPVELLDYVKILRKHWVAILLCMLLGLGAATVMTKRATPLYQATVGFFVAASDRADGTSSTAYTGILFSQQRVKSYASIVAGPLMAERVAADLGGPEQKSLSGSITAAAVPDTVLLNVTVTDTSPEKALAIAQSMARLFPQLADALERSQTGKPSPIQVSVIQEPRLPTTPFSPRPARNGALGLTLGLLVGIGVAVLREALDNTVKNPNDILTATGAATLGAIAYDPNAAKRPLIVQDSPQSARAEAFRQLRTNLQFIAIDGPLRSLTLTSSVPKEGKSTSACNLAFTLAQAGLRTVLIEGDLRRPRVADYLGMEGAVGLTSVLIGRVKLEDALQPVGDGTFQILASGPLPPNPSELLSSRGMRELIAQLEKDFDMVIIDAPPLLPVTDAAVLATMTSGAVLSVRCGSTRLEQLRRAAEALNAVDGKILGAVLNMVPRRGPDAYYNYGGYGYGYGTYNAKAYASNPRKLRMSAEDAALAVRSSQQPPADVTAGPAYAPPPSARVDAVVQAAVTAQHPHAPTSTDMHGLHAAGLAGSERSAPAPAAPASAEASAEGASEGASEERTA